ncbi:MAG: thioredoxin-disulfide reductase [Lachnospiraceae bacterium]|nr:thioredoxin-disulfide reductase [Lachnospiraceae bacterium]MBR5368913.1 thioredoxin-disulfide reductase [Lachnospiraceae bacterium]
MHMTYDLVIIGSGPAGLAAAIYAARAELQFIVLEKEGISGGQVLQTYEVNNYPGFKNISGFDLADAFRGHAESLGSNFVTCEVTGITRERDKTFHISCEDGTEYVARSVIACTGADHKRLGIPGEEEFAGAGVSYCATCDGAFFKNKTVAVIGGGDTAFEDALYLSRICEKVYLVHRRSLFRATGSLVSLARRAENIEFLTDMVPKEVCGTDGMVSSLVLKSVRTGAESSIDVSGVFVAIGMNPNSALFSQITECNKEGFIITSSDCSTQMPGLYAAGDVRTKDLRQIVTAVADGAVAVSSLVKYLSE